MPRDITTLLQVLPKGDPGVRDELARLVYDELRMVAGRQFSREGRAQSLQPTMLVHDAFMRLLKAESVSWQDRAHFYAFAARNMRQVLVEHARSRGKDAPLQLADVADLRSDGLAIDATKLEQALEALARLDPRQAQVVTLRFFATMTVEETALVLGVSERTVKNDWRAARAWLRVRFSR